MLDYWITKDHLPTPTTETNHPEHHAVLDVVRYVVAAYAQCSGAISSAVASLPIVGKAWSWGQRLYAQTFIALAIEMYLVGAEAPFGIGGWGGVEPSQVCAAMARNVPSGVWNNDPDACNEMILRRFQGVEIYLRNFLLYCLLRFCWGIAHSLMSRGFALTTRAAFRSKKHRRKDSVNTID